VGDDGRHVGRASSPRLHLRRVAPVGSGLRLDGNDRGLDRPDGVIAVAVSIGTLAGDSSHSAIRPGISCAEAHAGHRGLHEGVLSRRVDGPPQDGGKETGHCAKKNLAARKIEPIGKEHPGGHVRDSGSHRRKQAYQALLEEPHLNGARNGAKNRAGDDATHQGPIDLAYVSHTGLAQWDEVLTPSTPQKQAERKLSLVQPHMPAGPEGKTELWRDLFPAEQPAALGTHTVKFCTLDDCPTPRRLLQLSPKDLLPCRTPE
jgi:hypothetical protein